MSDAVAATRTAVARLGRQLIPEARRPLALYALYTLGLFLVFLVATFPHELWLRRVLAEVVRPPLAVEVTGVRLGWRLATSIDDLRVTERRDPPGPALLAAAQVEAAPSLLGLLRGSPYPLVLHADLYGGTLRSVIDPRPGALMLDAALADVDVSQWTGFALLADGTARGRVNATLALHGDTRVPTTLQGTAALGAAALALEGVRIRGLTVPDLHFSQLGLTASISNGRVEISELGGAGAEVTLHGSGNLLLRAPLNASLLNLELAISPAETAPQGLRLALNLLPGTPAADGTRTVHLSGPIAAPRLR